MIVKKARDRLTQPNKKNPFDDLIEYQTEGFDHSRDEPQFQAISNYATASVDEITGVDKCVAIQTHALLSPETAAKEMSAVAAHNTRVADPTLHLIASWPEHERPSHDQIFAACRHVLAALNLHEHQYMLAIHENTDNIHCHMVINRVHPQTFKSQHLSKSANMRLYEILHLSAREAEIANNWHHDNGLFLVQLDSRGQKQIVRNTRWQDPVDTLSLDISSTEHSPTVSLSINSPPTAPSWETTEEWITWAREHVVPHIQRAFPNCRSWSDIHDMLSSHGIRIIDTGGGFRFSTVDSTTGQIFTAPASKFVRFMKRTDLTASFGPFASSTTDSSSEISSTDRFSADSYPNEASSTVGSATAYSPNENRTTETLSKGRSLADNSQTGPLSTDIFPEDLDSNVILPAVRSTDAPSSQAISPTESFPTGNSSIAISPNATSQSSAPPHAHPTTDRAATKAARMAARAELHKRYLAYSLDARTSTADFFIDCRQLSTDRRAAQQQAKDKFRQDRRTLLKSPISSERKTAALATLAIKQLSTKLTIDADYNARRQALASARLPSLTWPEWLVCQAQAGDAAALSALRGLVYQAKRDAKQLSASQLDGSTIEHSPIESFPNEISSTDASTNEDLSTESYLAAMSQLLSTEEHELAIRPIQPHLMRPYQADALLRRIRGAHFEVTGNGNVRYSDANHQHLFTDRGNRVTFDRAHVTDNEIRLALLHARQKYGNTLTLTGNDDLFTRRMALLADELGIKIANPGIAAFLAAQKTIRESQARAAQDLTIRTATEAKVSTLAGTLNLTKEQAYVLKSYATKHTASGGVPPPARSRLRKMSQVVVEGELGVGGVLLPDNLRDGVEDKRSSEAGESLRRPDSRPTGTGRADEQGTRRQLAQALIEVRRQILAAHPDAIFITPSSSGAASFKGRPLFAAHHAFAQKAGPNRYVIHPLPPPSGDSSITVSYSNGIPSIGTQVRDKSKPRGKGGR